MWKDSLSRIILSVRIVETLKTHGNLFSRLGIGMSGSYPRQWERIALNVDYPGEFDPFEQVFSDDH